ncbi:MAG TPA: hypothetical protein VLA56_04530 [Pseudomonadales bacterium]|nr:hypothetical protein [Pseudomonadales bacterium]
MTATNERAEREAAAQAAFDPRLRTRNRAILVGLLILGMMPLLAALFFYYGNQASVSGAQTNNGALIDPPAQLENLGLVGDAGAVVADGGRVWRLLIVLPLDCDEACFERIHLLRQLHVLVGREQDRVIRLAAFPGTLPAGLAARLHEAFPRTDLVVSPPDLVARTLQGRELRGGSVEMPASGLPAAGVFTIDPLGNVVIFHGLEQIGEPLLFDLKRLLRLSNIG